MEKPELLYVVGNVVKVLGCLRDKGASDEKVKPKIESEIREAVSIELNKAYFRKGRTEEKVLYVFSGSRYEEVDCTIFMTIIKKALSELGVGIVYRATIAKKLFEDVSTSIWIDDFIPRKGVVSFRNCILDLDSGEESRCSGEMMTTIYLDFEYDPKAKCPVWMNFLHTTLTERASIDVLQEFLGSVFLDRNVVNINKTLFLYGSGANGKSVVKDAMGYVLGNYMSETSLHDLFVNMQANYYISDINGKLLNFAPDESDSLFSTGKFKALVEGKPQTARTLGQKPFKAKNLPLIAANMNKIPPSNDQSNGYYRRLIIIPFLREFKEEEQDKMLSFKLKSEVSGIFNWLMEGRRRIVKNRGVFTESENVSNALNKLRLDSNSILQFINDNNWRSHGSIGKERFSVSEFYDKYKKYCEDNGFKAKSVKNFKEDLNNEGFKVVKTRIDSFPMGNPTTGYVIFQAPTEEEREEEEDVAPILPEEDDEVPF